MAKEKRRYKSALVYFDGMEIFASSEKEAKQELQDILYKPVYNTLGSLNKIIVKKIK